MTVPEGPAGSQDDVAQAALIWAESGCSVIPIRADGTKRPAISWAVHQQEQASPIWIRAWWFDNPDLGIAIVCGKVSGNLEMTELEGRATSEDVTDAIFTKAEELGVEPVLSRLFTDGYCEITPSGGIHLLYRISDHEVPGNTKIARRPATWEELEQNPDDKVKVLAETRGEGGYVIVAPTGGRVHATGLTWEVQAGRIGVIPTITWDERNLIHDAIRHVLDEMPQPQAPSIPQIPTQRTRNPGATSPVDDFNDRASWDQILEPHGWQVHHVSGNTVYWTRPGKNRRDGHSATTGHAGQGAQDRLYVMSSATEFDTEVPMSKAHVYIHYNHRGDWREGVKALAAQGYGDQTPTFRAPNYDAWDGKEPADGWDWSTQKAQAQAFPWEQVSKVDSPENEASPTRALLRKPRLRFDHTLSGAACRFVHEAGQLIRYVTEEKGWRIWNGVLWERDDAGSQVSQAFEAMTVDMMDEADRLEEQAKTDEDKAPLAKSLRKHVTACRNANRTNVLRVIGEKVTVSISAFDADPRYLNLQNGVYDLVADEFLAHDPKYMLTKVAGVSYNKDAKAPKSEAFFGDLLPSEQMREFTLQGLAYSLTGEADRKAMFILQGQSNSGKTQLTEMTANLFGDYAVSVSPGTFTKRREHGPNAELHNMRGTRFVYTSETSHDIQLDEELVKRVTGKDTMTTRTLYEKPHQWIPQCAVWVATNNLPRFGSDSEAMWRRIKTIRFVNEFTDDGSSGHLAQPNIGRTLAAEEGSGLFNLLLEALRRYRSAGRLVEPPELKESVADHRKETDPLVQWVAVVQEKGELVEQPGAEVSIGTLRKAYSKWCVDEGYLPMAAQRFGIAFAQALKYNKRRSNGETLVVGWHWTGLNWMTGQTGYKGEDLWGSS